MEEIIFEFLENASHLEINIACSIVGILFGAIIAIIYNIPRIITYYRLKGSLSKNKELVDDFFNKHF